AITEHCVIGDQIRMPAAWCDIAGCGTQFSDPAALGEADNRARALAAGWYADAFGQLVCPGCQRRGSVARPSRAPSRQPDTGRRRPARAAARRLPLLHPGREAHPHQEGPPRTGGHVARTIIGLWLSAVRAARHHATRWLHLLAALASASNGWS